MGRAYPAVAVVLAGLFIAGGALAEAPEKLVSLEVSGRPLKEVLQRLAGETDYTFIFENTWSNLPVSVRLEQVPVQAGLRQILSSVNHALVYLPGQTIKILILETTPSPGTGSSAMNRPRAPARGVSAPMPTGPPVPEPETPASLEQNNPSAEGAAGEQPGAAESQPASN
jgi:type II secretory pathway component GspD/PulD (secretin)